MVSFTQVHICAPWICAPRISAWISFVFVLGKPSSIQDRQSCLEKKINIPIKTDKPGLFLLTTRQKPKSPIWVCETDHEIKGLLYLQIYCQNETFLSFINTPHTPASFLKLAPTQPPTTDWIKMLISHRLDLKCLFYPWRDETWQHIQRGGFSILWDSKAEAGEGELSAIGQYLRPQILISLATGLVTILSAPALVSIPSWEAVGHALRNLSSRTSFWSAPRVHFGVSFHWLWSWLLLSSKFSCSPTWLLSTGSFIYLNTQGKLGELQAVSLARLCILSHLQQSPNWASCSCKCMIGIASPVWMGTLRQTWNYLSQAA